MITFLTTEEVLLVHNHIVEAFANSEDPVEPQGVRDQGLLESAISRQSTGAGDLLVYDTVEANCATMMYGVCKNHPFYNGNKRTALVAGLWHLDRNNFLLESVTRKQLYRLMMQIASHRMATARDHRIHGRSNAEVRAITEWIRQNSRKSVRGERVITYAELYRILRKFGYELGEKQGNRQEVLKEKRTIFGKNKNVCVYKVPCPGDSKNVSIDEIKRVREALDLTERNGVDSASFYETHVILDGFIREHRNVLRELART